MAKKQEKSNELMLLKTAIREKNPDRLYFFHGDEVFLLQHYLEQLRKILVDELTESFNYHKLTVETFDLQSFADAVENLPMMADHTMVWVDEVDIFKLNESDREKLIDVLAIKPRERFEIPMGNDFTVWDLEQEFTVDPEKFISKGKATPFAGWPLTGVCVCTVCDGKIVYKKNEDR